MLLLFYKHLKLNKINMENEHFFVRNELSDAKSNFNYMNYVMSKLGAKFPYRLTKEMEQREWTKNRYHYCLF